MSLLPPGLYAYVPISVYYLLLSSLSLSLFLSLSLSLSLSLFLPHYLCTVSPNETPYLILGTGSGVVKQNLLNVIRHDNREKGLFHANVTIQGGLLLKIFLTW